MFDPSVNITEVDNHVIIQINYSYCNCDNCKRIPDSAMYEKQTTGAKRVKTWKSI